MMEQVGHSKEYLPYVSVLCNPGIRGRHWAKMSAIAGFDLTPDSGTTLFKVLNMQLAKFMDEFEQISAAASKEHSLEKALQRMKDEWEAIHFNTTVYRDTGVSILSSVDEIQNTLDDQIVKTQTMRGSPFIKACLRPQPSQPTPPIGPLNVLMHCSLQPFENENPRVGGAPVAVEERRAMTEWLKGQARWLYLEPIFSSEGTTCSSQ